MEKKTEKKRVHSDVTNFITEREQNPSCVYLLCLLLLLRLLCTSQINDVWKGWLQICCVYTNGKAKKKNKAACCRLLDHGDWQTHSSSPAAACLSSSAGATKKPKRINSFHELLSKMTTSKDTQTRPPFNPSQRTKVNIKSNNWICFLSRHHRGTGKEGE